MMTYQLEECYIGISYNVCSTVGVLDVFLMAEQYGIILHILSAGTINIASCHW